MRMPAAEETKLDVGNYGTTSNSSGDQQMPPWRWRSVVLAVIGQWCCFVCGVPAVVASLASYTDHRHGDFVNYRTRKHWAIKLAIAAIICGTILLAIELWLIITNAQTVRHLVEQVQRESEKKTTN